MHRLIQIWRDLRSSFWFIPSLMVAASIVFAVALIETESAMGDRWLTQWPRLFGAEPEGARQLLFTLVGSIMTVMGITFSMILVALASSFTLFITSPCRASRIIASVAEETMAAVDRMFPEKLGHEPDEDEDQDQVLRSRKERT